MIALLHFITLVITTMFAAAAAVFFNWLLLRGTFHLMRPATVERSARRTPDGTLSGADVVPGTVRAIRAFASRR